MNKENLSNLIEFVQKAKEERRTGATKMYTCPLCGKAINTANSKEFRDKLSWKEFEISGMCQRCQDGIFE